MRLARIVCIAAMMSLGITTSVLALEHTKDSLATVKANVEDKTAVLLDVREMKEWDAGHVTGALLLPLSLLRDGVTEEELNSLSKDKMIYIHCRSGARALVAGEILRKAGYDVRPLKPGYEALLSAGFSKATE